MRRTLHAAVLNHRPSFLEKSNFLKQKILGESFTAIKALTSPTRDGRHTKSIDAGRVAAAQCTWSFGQSKRMVLCYC